MKKPPGAGFDSCGAAAVVFFMPTVRFAKGDGFWGAARGAFVALKFSPLKESFRSPNADCCCCCCGDIMEDCRDDPKFPIIGLCTLGCGGFGEDAYSERIDLLRSGREEVILPGSELTDEGRGEGAGAVPKMSRPSSELESGCFGFGGDFGIAPAG